MVHRHNDNLTGEHPKGDAGQLTIFYLFMALWLSDIFLKYSSFLNEYIPLEIRLTFGLSAVAHLLLQVLLFGTIYFGKAPSQAEI